MERPPIRPVVIHRLDAADQTSPRRRRGTHHLECLTTSDVARLLQISRKRVCQLIDAGQIDAFRLGPKTFRIPRAAYLRFLRLAQRAEHKRRMEKIESRD